jgi:hypothetical protein
MQMETGTAAIALPRSTELPKRQYRDRFFLGMAVAATAGVLLGFARTYYLKTIFPLRSFPVLFHIHLGVFHPALPLGSTALFVLAIVIYDRRSRGRVHGVTLWAGLALMVSFPARLVLAKTDLWLGIAAWLIQ